MKAFIILPNNSASKSGMLLSMISAFVNVESVGVAENVVEAVDIIQRRYPDAPIFNSGMLEDKEYGYLASVLEDNGSFIMLSRHQELGDRCIYLSIDLSLAEQTEWVLNEIGETMREYQHFTAK